MDGLADGRALQPAGRQGFGHLSRVHAQGGLQGGPQPSRLRVIALFKACTAAVIALAGQQHLGKSFGPPKGVAALQQTHQRRRAQPVNSTLVIDTNSIPSSALESVEIISGGASAVYGADALGGVTNFKLRRNFQGIDLNFRTGITEEGDGEENSVSVLLGAGLLATREEW